MKCDCGLKFKISKYFYEKLGYDIPKKCGKCRDFVEIICSGGCSVQP